MESLDLVGVGRLHVSCSSAYYLATPSTAALCALPGHPWVTVTDMGGWVMVFYIGGIAELDRLAASLLVSVAESLPWALSLMLKRRLSCPLVLVRGRDVDGGWDSSFCLVRNVVLDLRQILGHQRRGLVVSYTQLVDAILQRMQLSL